MPTWTRCLWDSKHRSNLIRNIRQGAHPGSNLGLDGNRRHGDFMSAKAETGSALHLHDRDWVYVPINGKEFRRVELPQWPDAARRHASSEGRALQHFANALEFQNTAEQQSFVARRLCAESLLPAWHRSTLLQHLDVANTWCRSAAAPLRKSSNRSQFPVEIQMNGIPLSAASSVPPHRWQGCPS